MSDGRTASRASCWSVTAYGDEITLLKDKDTWPVFVRAVHGGEEKCPKTDRIHFQGMLDLNKTQRMAAIKKWLPTAHLEPAKDRAALQKYVLKAETAVGVKTTISSTAYVKMTAIMRLMATEYVSQYPRYSSEQLVLYMSYETHGEHDPIPDRRAERLMYAVISRNPELLNSIDYSKVKMFWFKFGEIFVRESLSITDSPQSSIDPAGSEGEIEDLN